MNRQHFIRLGLCEEATDLQTEGGSTPGATPTPTPSPTPEAGAPPIKLTIGERLKAAAGIMGGGEQAVVNLQTKNNELTGALAAKEGLVKILEGQLGEANAKIAILEADAKEAADAMTLIETESAKLKANEQNLTKRTAAGVKNEIAALGFPASQLPASSDLSGPVTLSYAEALAEYAKITDANARAAYYAQTIQPMLDRKA
jgi:hypothetical protein